MNAATAAEPTLRSCIVEVQKALIVEPSPQIAERITELITVPGRLEVAETVATEDEGIIACETHDIRVAVLELQLAAGTGFGVIRRLRDQRIKNAKLCTVIVLTNHAVPALKVPAFAAGADYFLDKSKDFATLPRLIGDVLRSAS
jgi:DNA-binding NarL/FixJ family response regulator